MPTQGLTDIFTQHAKYQDSVLEAFYGHLVDIVQRAQGHTLAKLSKLLVLDYKDQLLGTAANFRVLKKLPDILSAELDLAGYGRLATAWTNQFSQQLPFLQDVIEGLSKELVTPLPKLELGVADTKLLESVRAGSITSMDAVMDAAGTQAMQRALFAVGGLPFRDMTDLLASGLSRSIPQARTIADTSQNVFFRTASDMQFKRIESAYPKEQRLYIYSGPDDKITRPFCHRLLSRKRPFMRAEIDELDNGQLPNVWLTGGGWNCRHNFYLDVRSIQKDQARAAA